MGHQNKIEDAEFCPYSYDIEEFMKQFIKTQRRCRLMGGILCSYADKPKIFKKCSVGMGKKKFGDNNG